MTKKERYPSIIKITANNVDIYAIDIADSKFQTPDQLISSWQNNDHVDNIYSEVVRNTDGIKLIKYSLYMDKRTAEEFNGLKNDVLEDKVKNMVLEFRNQLTDEPYADWDQFKENKEELDEDLDQYVRKQNFGE